MTLISSRKESDNKKASNFNPVEIRGVANIKENSDSAEREELKEALNQAFDIIEGKRPRKTLSEALRG